jgi:hypothetical protein
MAASLAKRLRATLEHDDDERIDLANYTEVQAEELVAAAFAAPIPAREALRFTFIIGGGKLVRQKYNDALGKWLTAALRKAGYEEDKGAALGTAGAFKHQHDLGQNLIYLHVFPRVDITAPPAAAGGGGGGGEGGGGEGGAAARAPETPASRVVTCEVFDFAKLVPARVAAWSHKRRVLGVLQGAVRRLEEIEGKMTSRQALTPAEEDMYATASRPGLEEKVSWLQARMKEQVAEGALTAREREVVLAEMEDKLGALAAEAGKAEGKKAAAAAAAREALAGKRDAVKAAFAATSPATYPVRGLADIRKLRAEIARLDRLEAASAGKTMSPSEALARSRELDAREVHAGRLAALAEEARGWFEEADEFEARVKEQAGTVKVGKGK